MMLLFHMLNKSIISLYNLVNLECMKKRVPPVHRAILCVCIEGWPRTKPFSTDCFSEKMHQNLNSQLTDSQEASH